MKRVIIDSQSNSSFRGDPAEQAYDQRGGLCQVGREGIVVTTSQIDPAYLAYWEGIGFELPTLIEAGPFEPTLTLSELSARKPAVQKRIRDVLDGDSARLEFFCIEESERAVAAILNGIPPFCNFDFAIPFSRKPAFKRWFDEIGLMTPLWHEGRNVEDLERIGKVQKLISPGTPVINIDHHVTNDFFGDINLVEPKASSTAEVLYLLFKEAGHALTKDLAFNLYVGLMTDTGSFRFENTTARTHAICADLMRFNFSITDIYRKVYASIPYKDLKEFTKLISRFDVLYGGRVVCVELSRAILAKFSKQFDLRDTIFQFLRAMHGVDVFVIFTEDGAKKTRINLRSSSKFDVAKLASDFSGGGHKRASGCSIDKGMKAARNIFLGRIGKLLRA